MIVGLLLQLLLHNQFHMWVWRGLHFRVWLFIYALVYLGIWCVFLWYSVRTKSKGLLRLYQVFWLLLAMFGLISLGMNANLLTALIAVLLLFPIAPLIDGFWVIGAPDVIPFFILPFLMFLLGIIMKRKFVIQNCIE